MGFNWAAYLADLKAAGGFDYRKGPGAPTGSVGQETDMQRRLLRLGMRGLYLPEAVVWHYVAKSRCTPEWALAHAFRSGLCCALDAAYGCKLSWEWPWIDAARLTRNFAVFAATRFHTRRDSRFYGRLRLEWSAGYLEGLRNKAHRLPPKPRKAA
jgi:GT2 family glycosyltransferase